MARIIEVAILSSNILGPASLLDQGFDWVEEPNADKLAPFIAKLNVRELWWEARLQQWQLEGAIDDEPIEVSPGALVWLVSIDSSGLKDGNIYPLLGGIARMVGSCTPHAGIHFDRGAFDAQAIATELVTMLQRCPPIPYLTAAAKRRSTTAPAIAGCRASVASGSRLHV